METANDLYWVMYCSEDGDVRIEAMSKPMFLGRMKEGYYFGYKPTNTFPPADPQEWGKKMLVLKGGIVVPVAKERVVEYDIE